MEEKEEKNMRVFPVIDDVELRYNELIEKQFSYTNLPPENKRLTPGVGDLVSDNEILQIRSLIKEEAVKYGYPTTELKSDTMKTEFDKKIGEILIQNMNITPSIAATLPMWQFLNIYLIPDIVYWRWGDSKDHFVSRRRNYCGTQWWRYYLFSISKESMDVFAKMSDSEIADLYERPNTAGLPKHITDISIWFDELDKPNVKLNSRDLKRETIKYYNAELGYRLYYTLSDEQKYSFFKIAYNKAFLKLSKKEEK